MNESLFLVSLFLVSSKNFSISYRKVDYRKINIASNLMMFERPSHLCRFKQSKKYLPQNP